MRGQRLTRGGAGTHDEVGHTRGHTCFGEGLLIRSAEILGEDIDGDFRFRRNALKEELPFARRLAAEGASVVVGDVHGPNAAAVADDIVARVARGDTHAVRFLVPAGKTAFDDLVHGRIEFDNAVIEDFVIIRSDAYPTYHLSVVVDGVYRNVGAANPLDTFCAVGRFPSRSTGTFLRLHAAGARQRAAARR